MYNTLNGCRAVVTEQSFHANIPSTPKHEIGLKSMC